MPSCLLFLLCAPSLRARHTNKKDFDRNKNKSSRKPQAAKNLQAKRQASKRKQEAVSQSVSQSVSQ